MNKKDLKMINTTLIEAIERLNKLSFKDRDNAKLEIARSNAISQASKTVIQSIGIQLMSERASRLVDNNFKTLLTLEDKSGE